MGREEGNLEQDGRIWIQLGGAFSSLKGGRFLGGGVVYFPEKEAIG